MRSLKIWSINLEKIICSGIIEIEEEDRPIDKILVECRRICEKYKIWRETFEI